MEDQATHFVTGDAAFAVDRRGVIVIWNSAAEDMFSFTASHALGQHCWKLMGGQDIFGNRYCCERCPLMEMASRRETVHGTEVRFKTAHHGRRPVSLSSLVDFGANGAGLLLHICHPHEDGNGLDAHDHHPTRVQEKHSVLTKREHEVLELLSEGKSTRQIASSLCISYTTVRNHVQHILEKLNVHSRLEAVIAGQTSNLI